MCFNDRLLKQIQCFNSLFSLECGHSTRLQLSQIFALFAHLNACSFFSKQSLNKPVDHTEILFRQDVSGRERKRERDGKSKYSQTHRLFKLCNEVLSLLVNLVILYSLPIPCANLTNNRQNGLTINQLSHDLRIELFISHLMGHHYYY